MDVFYRFGGFDGVRVCKDLWAFDTMDQEWAEVKCTGPMPAPRCRHAMTIVKNTVYVFGGICESGFPSDEFAAFKISSAFFLFNLHCRGFIDYPTAQRWYIPTSVDSTPSPRCEHAIVSVGKKIFVVGGTSNSGSENDDAGHIFYALDMSKSYSYALNILLIS